MSELLRRFEEAGILDTLDRRFALAMGRLATDLREEVLLGAALCCRAPRQGHVCVDLDQVEARTAAEPDEDGNRPHLDWPPPAAWRAALAGSAMVGDARGTTPLVLHENRLYLRRYHSYEERLAQAIRGRLEGPAIEVDEVLLAEDLARIWPGEGDADQQRAAIRAVRSRFCVISGGPGTGKTTTLSRVLALLARQAIGRDPDRLPRILMMAPTGKAAARMTDAVQPLPDDVARPDQLPVELRAVVRSLQPVASTIHRALGIKGGNLSQFWATAGNPLSADVVIVDEASMVSFPLMTKLVEAVDPRARLILVGDKNQLASVEAGAVLADICAAGVESGPLAGAIVHLTHNYRASDAHGIQALARAINRGDAAAAFKVFDDPRWEGQLAWERPVPRKGLPEAARVALVAALIPAVNAATTGTGADRVREALKAQGAFRVLCAHRRGVLGVETLNGRIAALLTSSDGAPRFRASGEWYPGRPVLVTENDRELELYNGDVGVILANRDRSLSAWFNGPDDVPRAFSPTQLPAHETVFAMTIHKSQGSEFEHVMVCLPEEPSPVLTRELLYTAVTRARSRLTLVATPEAIIAALSRDVQRFSGLRARLTGGEAP